MMVVTKLEKIKLSRVLLGSFCDVDHVASSVLRACQGGGRHSI